MKNRLFLAAVLACAALFCSCSNPRTDVVLGDERLSDYLPLLKGQKVAILSNQTGIVGDVVDGVPSRVPVTEETVGEHFLPLGSERLGPHLLDVLLENGVNVTEVFSPEHGFRGTADAGELVADDKDPKTGVPVVSLYKAGKSGPDQETLDAFDVLVVDIQDVGLRYYTYYITMQKMMGICAANGKKVIVLDRPNPNGFYVEGDILEEKYYSGIGSIPVPTVHGMTLGELALMMNGEGWLKDSLKCELTVIPCKNYTHSTLYSLILPPSPNLRDMRSVFLYSSICFFEGTIATTGRGTDFPFETYGHPEITGHDFSFTPQSVFGARNPRFLGQECFGADLRKEPLDSILARGINMEYVIDAYVSLNRGDEFFNPGRHFELLTGSWRVRDVIERSIAEGLGISQTAKAVEEGWADEVAGFLERRKPYLLYPES